MKYTTGWLKDYPDIRDYNSSSKKIREIFSTVKAPKATKTNIDLRQWCSPIDDQGELGSCTAHAGTGLLEYFEKKTHKKHIDASRLFLYKTTRNLMKVKGDTGAYLRLTMQAMAMFGVPPEEYCPYQVSKFDTEPSAFLYSFASNYQALKYYRIDTPSKSKAETLRDIKTKLAGGFPLIFGFTVYSSLYDQNNGDIPFPSPTESVEGGHAIMAVGYDDSKEIKNTRGALLIRNSWGTSWGDAGYGWLPYEYVLQGLADDFWSLAKMEWVDTGVFSEQLQDISASRKGKWHYDFHLN